MVINIDAKDVKKTQKRLTLIYMLKSIQSRKNVSL